MYSDLADRKQMKFADLEKYDIDEEVFQKYAQTRTAKMYKDLDMVGYIVEVANNIDNKPLSIKEQMKYEIENLGTPISLYKQAPKSFFVVTEYKTFKDKLKPYVTLYNVNTGDTIKTKVKDKDFFAIASFGLYDLIKVVRWKTQKKTKCIGGVWQKTDEDEQILSEWECY